jgi:hypothetical protein
MTAIVRMLRFGRFYNVRLACGHEMRASLEEAAWKQLFIGKMVRCEQCRE